MPRKEETTKVRSLPVRLLSQSSTSRRMRMQKLVLTQLLKPKRNKLRRKHLLPRKRKKRRKKLRRR